MESQNILPVETNLKSFGSDFFKDNFTDEKLKLIIEELDKRETYVRSNESPGVRVAEYFAVNMIESNSIVHFAKLLNFADYNVWRLFGKLSQESKKDEGGFLKTDVQSRVVAHILSSVLIHNEKLKKYAKDLKEFCESRAPFNTDSSKAKANILKGDAIIIDSKITNFSFTLLCLIMKQVSIGLDGKVLALMKSHLVHSPYIVQCTEEVKGFKFNDDERRVALFEYLYIDTKVLMLGRNNKMMMKLFNTKPDTKMANRITEMRLLFDKKYEEINKNTEGKIPDFDTTTDLYK